MQVNMPNGKIVEVDNDVYENVSKIILESQLTGKWLTYVESFPVLKPRVIEVVEAGVWNFMAVIRGLEAENKIDITEDEDGELLFFIH